MQTGIVLGLIGLIAGLLSGVLGLGGAIVIIPALIMLLGYSQQMAQGTALMMMVLPVGALASLQYGQKGLCGHQSCFNNGRVVPRRWLFWREAGNRGATTHIEESICNHACGDRR